jgi:hypothetical protein
VRAGQALFVQAEAVNRRHLERQTEHRSHRTQAESARVPAQARLLPLTLVSTHASLRRENRDDVLGIGRIPKELVLSD